MKPPENTGRNHAGRWKRGVSGNKAGKPKGARHKATLAAETLLEGEAEALSRAQTTCLITDLQMPGLSGLDLQQELQSRGYHTPVILVTAYPSDKHRTHALNNGAVGFLSKPFSDSSLIECLTDAIKLNHKSDPGCRKK